MKHTSQIHSARQPLYFDVDDVAITTIETLVYLINKNFNKPHNLPPRTVSDVKDWQLTSIYKDLTPSDLTSIFESDEFWYYITMKPEFTSIFTPQVLRSYNLNFVTKGTQINLEKKYSFLEEYFPYFNHFNYIGLLPETSKSTVDMSGGILIDDNMQNLIDSNASIKILLTNNLQTQYNNAFNDFKNEDITEIYRVNTLAEVKQILEFNLGNNLIEL